MSFVAALAGAAVVAKPIHAAKVFAKISTNTCTATGALTLMGLGFGVVPYMQDRAPLSFMSREKLRNDFKALIGPAPETVVADVPVDYAFRLSFEDLRRPWLFNCFLYASRFVFAAYADATGVMTTTEFRCALHKMIDLTWMWYCPTAESYEDRIAHAEAVRTVLSRVSNAAFKVIDQDDDGRIDVYEFTEAVLLVIAVANGKVQVDAPIIQRLAFRVVDEDGDGYVTRLELQKWVELAAKFDTLPRKALYPYGGFWGWFGREPISPARLARKWLNQADEDKDRRLSPEEFASLLDRLQIHEVIRRMATRIAIS